MRQTGQLMNLLLRGGCLLVLMCLLTVGASAASATSGKCGGSARWSFNATTKTLTISGTGAMYDYDHWYGKDGDAAPWYQEDFSEQIESVVIGSGITYVGVETFYYGYPNLKSVTFAGNKVTEIGREAFDGAEAMSSIILPSSLKTIGYHALPTALEKIAVSAGDSQFYTEDGVLYQGTTLVAYPASKQDGSYTIISGTTGIASGALDRSYELTSITVPGSVKSIPDLVFPKNVTSITLGEGIKSIDSSAFWNCPCLTEVTIPASVTNFTSELSTEGRDGPSTFSIYFKGDAPTMDAAFADGLWFDEKVIIYCLANASGWDAVQQQSDIADYVEGGSLEFKAWDGRKKITTNVAEQIPSSKYGVLVVDHTGMPIEGATVTYDTQSGTTDQNGLALFSKFTIGEPAITVTCSGYKAYSNGNTNYSKSADGYDIVILYSEDESSLKLAHAYYQTTRADRASLPIDLLSKTQRLSLTSKSGTFSLKCMAVDPDAATNYFVFQGDRVHAASPTGEFSLEISQFSEGGDVFIRVYGTGKDYVDTPINLSFAKDALVKADSIKLGDKFTMKVSENIPFIGGSNISFDIPDLPVDIVLSEDTVHVGLNVKINENDTFKEDYLDSIDDLKDVMKQLKRANGINVDKNLQEKVNRFMRVHKMDVPVAGKVNSSIVGYGEGKLDEDGLAEVKLEIYILINASVTIQSPTVVVVVVPMTFSVKVGVDGKISTVVGWDLSTNTLNGDFKLTLTPNLEAFGGAGIGKAIGVGAYGSAELPIEMQLVGTSQTPGVNSVDLTGQLGLKAYVAFFEYKKAFAYQTWHIYTRTKEKELRTAALGDSWMAELYDEDAYEMADLSYLANESDWLSDGIFLASMEGGTTDTSELMPLLTSTYRNMQPMLGEANGMPVLVWVRANTDASRGTYDYPQLVYSVYESGRWTEPQPVDAGNMTADAAPALATAPDGTLYLAYQSSSEQMQTNASLDDFAAVQTIVVARFDTDVGKFTDFTTVSENGVFSRSPVISADGDMPLVAWVANAQNDYFMQNETGSIRYAQLVNGEWQSGVLAETCSTVTDLAVGLLDGQPAVAAVLDDDANLTTTGDSVLLCYPALSGGEQVASGSIGGIVLAKLLGAASSSLLWFDDTGLLAYDGTNSAQVFEAAQQPNGFTVLSDRVLFNAASGENGSELFAFVYDGGTWSDAVQVTAQEQYLQSYAAAEIGDAVYLAAVQANVTITEDSVEDACTLAWGILDPVTDLAVCAVSVDHAEEKPNGELAVSVDIQNLGDTTVSEFTVTICDKNETVVSSKDFDVSIAPTAVETVSLTMTLGATVTTEDYTVTVTAVGDSVKDNDSAQITVGYSDLDVSASTVQIGESSKVYIRVANNGAAASGGQMTISCGDTTLQVVQLESLAQGEISLYEVGVTKEQLGGELAGVLRIALTPSTEDYDTFNDSDEVFVRLAYTEGIEILDVSPQGVSVNVQNAAEVCVYAALYDGNGRMLDLASQTLKVDAGKTTIPMDASARSNAAKLKVFMLNVKTTTPQTICAERVLSN